MKKRILAVVLVGMTVISAMTGCGSGNNETAVTDSTGQTAAEDAGEVLVDDEEKAEINDLSGDITFVCGATEALGVQAVFDEFQKQYPDAKLNITTSQDVTDFETMMTAWIASNSLPDMYIAQVGATEQGYAREGYLLPLTDTGIIDNLIECDTSLITYDGEFYAFPLTSAISVTLCNNAKLKELGIEINRENYPKSMDDFLNLMQQVRDAGVNYPFGIAGADLSSCTAWPFQYMYQVLYGDDPNYYADILKGEKAWNGPEFVEMFTEYDRLREYVSPDSTGKTMNEVYADFVKGDTVFFSQVASTIKSIQELDPESDILLIPSSFTKDAKNQTLIAGVDAGLSICSTTDCKDLCVQFAKYLTSEEGCTIFNNATGFIPTEKVCNADTDPAYDLVLSIEQAGELPISPIQSRQWISGFKELLKSGCQNWLAGEDAQEVCDTIQEEHQRLMDADPEWVENFLSNYTWK